MSGELSTLGWDECSAGFLELLCCDVELRWKSDSRVLEGAARRCLVRTVVSGRRLDEGAVAGKREEAAQDQVEIKVEIQKARRPRKRGIVEILIFPNRCEERKDG